ncbi:MAG: threonine/serine exporter [Clostridiales bacterium]|nr:threonine/serine exporter [Clostridiales bacterium]
MSIIIQCLASMFASAFFGELLHQPRKTMVYTSLIGLNGYVIYLLINKTAMAFFIAALAVGLLCELTARIMRMATTLFLVSALIPLVPGLGLYRTMMFIAQSDYSMALTTGIETLTGIGAIALSITISNVIFSNISISLKPQNSLKKKGETI